MKKNYLKVLMVLFMSISSLQVMAQTTTWNGTTWDNGVPTSTTNAIISGGYDITTNGDITCADLSINVAGSIMNDPSDNITLTGNLHFGTPFTSLADGTVTFNGTSAQAITAATQANIHNMVINNTAGVTISATTVVNGIISLTAGALTTGGNLNLSGDNALIDFSGSGSISGNMAITRTLDGSTQAGYRYISTCVTGQTLANIAFGFTLSGLGTTFSPGSGAGYTWNNTSPYPNHFIYDQSLISGSTAGAGPLNGESLNNELYGWETAAASTDAFNPGAGIAIRISSNRTTNFVGPLQTADVVLPLPHGGETASGWHLIGNPFAATLDWDAVFTAGDATGLDSDGTIYVFDANGTYTGAYGSYNPLTDAAVGIGSKDIAYGQAFFVRAASGGGNVTMRTSHTTATPATFYKTKATDWEGELRMKLIDDNGNEDELLLYFIDGADEKKGLGDATKFFDHADNFPKLTSIVADEYLMMDCRKPIDREGQTIQLLLKAGEVGAYTLKASTIAQFASGTEIFLEDKKENMLIDLNVVDEYTFDLAKGELVEDRFNIILKNNAVTSIEDDLAERGVSVFSSGNQLRINFADAQSAEVNIAVYDLQGRQLFAQSTAGQNQISLDLPESGIFIVKVENARGVVTKKVYLD